MTITYLPPRRGISQSEAYAEAVSYGVAGDPPLITVAVYGDSIVDPQTGDPVALYMVNDYLPLVATLEADAPLDAGQEVTFVPVQMSVTFPTESEAERIPAATIEFAGASNEVTPYLRAAAASRQTVTLLIRTYLPSDLSGPHELPPMRVQVKDVEVNAQLVTVSASYGDIVNVPFPQVLYELAKFPTLE
jgi:hypothetical protein